MLDYACGDGLITRALKPLFSSAIGIDLSASMLEKYRETASRLGVGPGEMMGVRGDLLVANAQPTDPALPDEVLSNFDLVAISMALHHVEDPDFAIERLAARLKTGGKLLVVDWAPLDGSTPAQREYQEEMRQNLEQGSLDNNAQPHASSHTISRPNGFTEQEMTQLLEIAGCKDVKWKLAEELSPIPVIHTKAQLYWAIATKA